MRRISNYISNELGGIGGLLLGIVMCVSVYSAVYIFVVFSSTTITFDGWLIDIEKPDGFSVKYRDNEMYPGNEQSDEDSAMYVIHFPDGERYRIKIEKMDIYTK